MRETFLGSTKYLRIFAYLNISVTLIRTLRRNLDLFPETFLDKKCKTNHRPVQTRMTSNALRVTAKASLDSIVCAIASFISPISTIRSSLLIRPFDCIIFFALCAA